VSPFVLDTPNNKCVGFKSTLAPTPLLGVKVPSLFSVKLIFPLYKVTPFPLPIQIPSDGLKLIALVLLTLPREVTIYILLLPRIIISAAPILIFLGEIRISDFVPLPSSDIEPAIKLIPAASAVFPVGTNKPSLSNAYSFTEQILIVVPPILTSLLPTISTFSFAAIYILLPDLILILFYASISIVPATASIFNAAPLIEASEPSYVRIKPRVLLLDSPGKLDEEVKAIYRAIMLLLLSV
jgi:hypothetical protein